MSYEKDFVLSKFEWPYSIRYDVENDVCADVLVVGGGIAGCWAAISAARRGVKVVMVDKSTTIKSGAGGMGCDHWNSCSSNPCSKVTPEELAQATVNNHRGWDCGIISYIDGRDGYETLLELEKMGGKVRDTEDEFKGAEFRDEKTKLLFAYDYENNYCIRTWGTTFKPALASECRRLGVNMYERTMATSLLTEGGKQGARVVGATGVNARTGEFYVFKAKATILCLSRPDRVWVFTTEHMGLQSLGANVPNCPGDGHAMAWEAGAEFTMMEKISPSMVGGFGYPMYATGNPNNTWLAATMVDAKGKEIPWVDRDGNILKTVSQRYRPVPGQKLLCRGGGVGDNAGLRTLGAEGNIYEYQGPTLILDLGERIAKGEFKLPLYADLPSMSEHERRVIFGLMIGQEGKTWILYRNLTQAGFDPDKDMLQSYHMMTGRVNTWQTGGFISGGVVVDWDLKTNLAGLYAAGRQVFGSEDHDEAATTGRYAGAKAADYALKAAEPKIVRRQVEAEKARVYAPIRRKEGMEWKEFNSGICRIMQEWCGEKKSEELLKIGLTWLKELREGEAQTMYARNPHELMRVLECFSILTCGEMIMHASLARKASSRWLGHYRIDYPELDPPEWNKWITMRLVDGVVKFGELPIDYWLKPPNAPTLEDNYEHYKPWK